MNCWEENLFIKRQMKITYSLIQNKSIPLTLHIPGKDGENSKPGHQTMGFQVQERQPPPSSLCKKSYRQARSTASIAQIAQGHGQIEYPLQ